MNCRVCSPYRHDRFVRGTSPTFTFENDNDDGFAALNPSYIKLFLDK